MPAPDPVTLAQTLIQCASVTPEDGGTQAVLAGMLEKSGFAVTHLPFGTTPNFFARLGTAAPHFCFAGHTDVVPAGGAWRHDPFAGKIESGVLFGRGACDMKGAIAAFVAAVQIFTQDCQPPGSISLLITGDEEGPAQDGTVRVLKWMAAHGHIPDFCLVGEPTNPGRLGDLIKIGRRGSLNATLTVHGTQGHAAYPQRADNPNHRLVQTLAALIAAPLDTGTAWFEPSSLQITSIDVGNSATNVIPASACARFNIRFNDLHSGASLENFLRAKIAPLCPKFDLEIAVGGEAFLTPQGDFAPRLRAAIQRVTGFAPKSDTGGGTSDARFIARYAPVAEFGLVGASMHQVDEHVPIADLHALTRIYTEILREFLA